MQISTAILSDFKNGHIHSFYKEIYPSLLRFAIRFLGEELAYLGEDCVSDSIFKAYQKRMDFNTSVELKAYLYTCVHNEIVNIFKKNERQKKFASSQLLITDNLIDHIVMQETLDRLQKVVDELPPRLRKIYELSFEEGMKRAEIAERLEVSEATVKRDKRKIIEILREKFRDEIVMQIIVAGIVLSR